MMMKIKRMSESQESCPDPLLLMFPCSADLQFNIQVGKKKVNKKSLLRDEATGFYENFCFKNFFGDFSGGPSLNVMQTK